MRASFENQLRQLHLGMIEMGALCERAIANAAKALLDGEPGFAQETAMLEGMIDGKEREIESLCLKLLLQQQPVARDLRQISSALKMITDMERIGDQAADIAEISTMANLTQFSHTLHIGDMARATIKMVTESIDAYVRRDLDLAQAVVAYDDVVDGLFRQVRRELIALIQSHPDSAEHALDCLMIAKYFERIGDHATNIADWVDFALTGQHKGV